MSGSKKSAATRIQATTSVDNGAMIVNIPGVPKGAMPKKNDVLLRVGACHSIEVTKATVNGHWCIVLRVLGDTNALRYMQLRVLLGDKVAKELAAGWSPESLTRAEMPLAIRDHLLDRVSTAIAAQQNEDENTAPQTLITPAINGREQRSLQKSARRMMRPTMTAMPARV